MQLLTDEQEAMVNILNAIQTHKTKTRYIVLFKIQDGHELLYTVGLFDKMEQRWLFKESCIKSLRQAEKLLLSSLKQLKLL